ncbi:MAG: hypothetical protein ABIO35_05535, partial [Nitrobacter sp.]
HQVGIRLHITTETTDGRMVLRRSLNRRLTMSNPNGDVRELTTSELNAVSGGEGVMQGTKIKITMDKGTLDISYVSTNGGTPLPYAHWTPK